MNIELNFSHALFIIFALLACYYLYCDRTRLLDQNEKLTNILYKKNGEKSIKTENDDDKTPTSSKRSFDPVDL